MKPFLLIQLRPEDEAADNELEAFRQFGGLDSSHIKSHRIDKQPLGEVDLTNYSGIIVGGGPFNVSDPEESKSVAQKRLEQELLKLLDEISAADFPFLGACYGIGILAKYLGGEVSKAKYGEPVGAITVSLTAGADDDPLMQNVASSFRAFGRSE